MVVCTLLFAILFAFGYYHFVFKKKKKDKVVYDIDWKKYEDAMRSKDMAGIDKHGNNVLWNYYLKPKHLDEMIKDLGELPKGKSKIRTLRKNCMNKRMEFNILDGHRPFATQS